MKVFGLRAALFWIISQREVVINQKSPVLIYFVAEASNYESFWFVS